MNLRRLNHFLFGTLRGRMILSVAAVHAVMMSLFIVDLTRRQRTMLLEQQEEEANTLAQTLATTAAGWLAANDLAGLHELVDAQRQNPELVFAILADQQGRILAHTDRSRNGQFLLDLPGETRPAVYSKTVDLADVVSPVILAGRQVGWARIGIVPKTTRAKLDQITLNGERYALGAIVVGSVIAWFMGRRMTRRLYAVQDTIHTVRSSDSTARVRLTGDDEAAELAREFNTMLDALAERSLELRVSEERNRSILLTAMDGFWRTDSQGRLLDVNEAYCRMSGYSREELLTMRIADVEAAESAAETAAHMETVMARGEDRFVSRHHRKDRSLFTVEVSVQYKAQESGQFIAFLKDITERKQAEGKVREQANLLEQTHDAIMVIGLDDRYTYWNKGAELITGVTVAEALGKNVEELFGTDPVWAKSVRRSVMETGIWHGEFKLRRKDGQSIVLDLRVNLVRDEAGRPIARLSIGTDITEKKQMEEQVRRTQRLENLGMLAAGVAHDMNNILAPLVMIAPLFRQGLTAVSKEKYLSIIERSTDRGTKLVRQILSFAREVGGEAQLVQVRHLLMDLIGLIEETFPKSIRLEQHIPAELWLVQGNATQLHQVVLNLCVNARDAMPAGGTLSITALDRRLDVAAAAAITGTQPGDWLMLEISDTGTGIAPEVLQRIWEPFFTTKGEDKGTGLGLSTVRGIVASHHGFLEVLTEVGRGTTFRVYLPAVVNEVAPGGSAAPMPIPGGHGELILVVDDEAPILDLIQQILNEHGYLTLTCRDGLEAIELFNTRAAEIALVVTDVEMPRLGGLALARAMRQIHPDTRFLAISGLSRNDSSATALAEIQKLAQAILSKPFSAEALLGAVHSVLHPAQ